MRWVSDWIDSMEARPARARSIISFASFPSLGSRIAFCSDSLSSPLPTAHGTTYPDRYSAEPRPWDTRHLAENRQRFRGNLRARSCDGKFALDHHSQRGCLDAPDGKLFVVAKGIGAR